MKRKNKIFRKVIIVLAVLALLTGCAGQEPEAEDTRTPTDDNLIVVGVSQEGSESVWRTANTRSVKETLTKENGYFLIFKNVRQKQENQIKALRSFISQRVDYIVFSPIVEDGWDTVLREAREAEIPVILMDRKINVKDESLYTAWVGSDFVEEGRNAGKWLEDYLKGQRFNDDQVNIVVLQGTAGTTAMFGRTQGFEEIAAKHENWNILEQTNADFTTAKGEEEMRRLLNTYPEIDVLVSQNDDMTFGALEAIQSAGRTTGTGGDITVISFDGTKKALEKVKTGAINVDVECNPYQGKYIEEIIQALETGQSIEKDNYVEEKVFTQKNVLSVLNDRTY